MTVEVTNNFDGLDATRPLNTTIFNEGDDHIRLLKEVIKNVFPGISGNGFNTPILALEVDLNFLSNLTSNLQLQLTNIINGQVPIGGIMASKGLITNIPINFKLCDGTNGTPNMVNMFAYATVMEVQHLITGGTNDSTVESHSHTNSHSHTASTDTKDHTHNVNFNNFAGGGSGVNEQGAAGGTSGVFTISQISTADGAHNHTFTVDNIVLNTSTDGSSGVGANIPPYVKLFYMQRKS